MNDAQAARELVAAAKELAAAGGMKRDMQNIIGHFSRMQEAIKKLEGLFYYRISGSGSFRTEGGIPDRSEPFLDPKQMKEAEKASAKLTALQKTMDSVWDDIKDLDKDVRGIDDFMRYN
jgi:hypothetical protein